MLKLKRVYEPASKSDGYRILVDRLWPRGVSKQKADLDLWLKDVAPSTQLRKWFGHDPKKWTEFQKKYKKELKNSAGLKELKDVLKFHKNATLLYGAKDQEHNEAIVLKNIIDKKSR